MLFTRLFADRRRGIDRRAIQRRHVIRTVAEERRAVVDRRRGAERRSTLDRRGRAMRVGSSERPVEHVRNALQLLREIASSGQLGGGGAEDLGAAIDRLYRAIELLEGRPAPPASHD